MDSDEGEGPAEGVKGVDPRHYEGDSAYEGEEGKEGDVGASRRGFRGLRLAVVHNRQSYQGAGLAVKFLLPRLP